MAKNSSKALYSKVNKTTCCTEAEQAGLVKIVPSSSFYYKTTSDKGMDNNFKILQDKKCGNFRRF